MIAVVSIVLSKYLLEIKIITHNVLKYCVHIYIWIYWWMHHYIQ